MGAAVSSSTPRSSNPTPPLATGAVTIGTALASSAPLAHLQALLRESTARFETVRPLLPAALVEQLRPGPIDESGGWCLLASNTAAAAKLRQLLPVIERALLARVGKPTAVRVRVQSARPR
ncbi:MAG TPA: hypothetical protein VFR90_09265 [Methylibium sp.]|uniref:hypothetical protein n=1 Tax=Methylibium sp. TaxID=2067992 RepID=UPI002DB96755|nr:hypothetical protein [Methylibium sp.]HEU4459297.1 hypothetical protein [Methylibium sp.]